VLLTTSLKSSQFDCVLPFSWEEAFLIADGKFVPGAAAERFDFGYLGADVIKITDNVHYAL
jgi:hypothetical protein